MSERKIHLSTVLIMMLPSITINFKQWCSHGQVDKDKEKRKERKGKEKKERKMVGRDSYVVDA